MTRSTLCLYLFLAFTVSKSQNNWGSPDDESSGSSGYSSGFITPEDIDYITTTATTQAPFTTPNGVTRNDADNSITCVVPPYITDMGFTTDTSLEEFEELVAEWRCFLVCALAGNSTVSVDFTYEAWPFLALEGVNCRLSANIHECTRGCITPRDDQCSNTCGLRCASECTCTGRISQCNCINPDVNDPWFITANCDERENQFLRCSTKLCKSGCNIDAGPTTLDVAPRPSRPITSPTLERYSLSTQSKAGLYTVNFTSAIPANTTSSGTVSFVLRVEDVQSGNVKYIWQHSPMEVKSLAGYVCRNISVSFAVVSVFGYSDFSPVTNLQVYGDPRHVPNAVANIDVIEQIDTRLGYFGHARLTVSWDRHENGLHLQYFQVIVSAPSKAECGNDTFFQQVNATENVSSYSVTVEAESPSGIPFMGCTNHFTIIAVGPEGSTSELESTSLQKIDPPGVEFLCSRIWDSKAYFVFNLTWIMPLYLVHNHIMERLIIRFDIVDEKNRSVNVDFSKPGSKEFPIPNTNETVFRFLLNETQDFYRPLIASNRFYSFMMFIDWNEDNLHYVPNPKWYDCLLSARSPAPSSVRNLTIVDHSLVGNQQISLTLRWLPPAQPNGDLIDYNVCIGPYVLNVGLQELPVTPHSCRGVEPTTTTTNGLVLHYFKNDSSPCLYLQMRANNMFVPGNWSEPSVFSIDASGTCETKPTPTKTSPVTVVVPAVICGIIAILLVLTCTVCVIAYIRMLRKRKRFWRISQEPCNDPMFTSGPRNPFLTTPTEPGSLLPTTDEWEISPSEVLMEEPLGEGAFGEVYKGVLKGPITSSTVRPWMRNAIGTPVAIKLLKLSARGSERQDFLSEIEMMKRVAEGQNANVVCLLACVTIQEPLCLITEFVKFGDLLSYLRNNRKFYTGNQLEGEDNPYLELGNISSNDLISFAYQIASGMEYLSSLGIVHRDLASRNVLVDDGKVLKITDFGMSRTTETNEIYVQKSKGRVPLKWMAIESIVAREFTTFSDVWSYGVTLWEITTLGGFPYPTVHNEELLSLLKQGYRMEKPDNCSPEIYDIMLGCWNGESKKRPTFTELRAKFDNMLLAERQDAYIDLQIDAEKPYYQMDFKMELNEQGSQQQSADLLQVTPTVKRHSLATEGGSHTPWTVSEISPAHLSLSANSPLGSHPSMHGASPSKEPAQRNQMTELLPNGSAEGNDIGRPVSMLLPGRERQAANDNESRYVAEPSRLAATNPTFAVRLNDHSSSNSMRRRSDGGLTLNMNGVAGNHEGNVGIVQQPEIIVIEDTF